MAVRQPCCDLYRGLNFQVMVPLGFATFNCGCNPPWRRGEQPQVPAVRLRLLKRTYHIRYIGLVCAGAPLMPEIVADPSSPYFQLFSAPGIAYFNDLVLISFCSARHAGVLRQNAAGPSGSGLRDRPGLLFDAMVGVRSAPRQ